MKSLSFALILLLQIAFGSTEESQFTDGLRSSSMHMRRYAPITPRRRGSLPESSAETARDQPAKMKLTEKNGFLLLRISPLLYTGYRPSVADMQREYKRADIRLGSGLLSERNVAVSDPTLWQGDLEPRNRSARKRELDSEISGKRWYPGMLLKSNSGLPGTRGAEFLVKRGYDDLDGEFSRLCEGLEDCPAKSFAFVQRMNPRTEAARSNKERFVSRFATARLIEKY